MVFLAKESNYFNNNVKWPDRIVFLTQHVKKFASDVKIMSAQGYVALPEKLPPIPRKNMPPNKVFHIWFWQ